jgi:hypothetical protein
MKQQLKRIIPEVVLEGLRNIKGTNNIKLSDSFNTYNEIERKRSIIPNKFNWSQPTPLCRIMKEQGTDKALFHGESMHNYTPFYYTLLKQFQYKSIKLFEMGIGTTNPHIANNMGAGGRPGASLRGWKEFFPLAQIFAADIDTNILFQDERIKTFYVDQLSSTSIQEMWSNKDLVGEFDLIIDDGLHTFEANTCFFENSHAKLSNRGIYVIEDIHSQYLPEWKEIIGGHYKNVYTNLKFTLLSIPNRFNLWDNNLIVIEKLS